MIDRRPITKEEFLEQNPFGSVFKINTDGTKIALTEEEYADWVEFSQGVWEDGAKPSAKVVILP